MESIGAVRLRIAATACGTARWVLDDLRARLRRPHRSGAPLAEHEQVQALVAECAMDLYAARAATWAAARLAESGAPAVAETAMAKALATEAAGRVVDRAIQLTGGAAVVAGHALARLYTRVRAWRIGEGTTEVLKLVIGRALLADDTGARAGDGESPASAP
jgi:acyl-CoA dehydrogenase